MNKTHIKRLSQNNPPEPSLILGRVFEFCFLISPSLLRRGLGGGLWNDWGWIPYKHIKKHLNPNGFRCFWDNLILIAGFLIQNFLHKFFIFSPIFFHLYPKSKKYFLVKNFFKLLS
jgi:hypothetical protein